MVRYVLNGPTDDEALNELFDDAWPNHQRLDFAPLLEASLVYVLAYDEDTLVGFIRVVACGTKRGFVLGPTVRTSAHRQGIGTALLNHAADAAKEAGVKSLHVDFASHLRPFYAGAGFKHTASGVRRLG